MGNLGGRPTKLDEDVITQARQYLEETVSVGVDKLLPTIEGLALALNIGRDTVYEWEKVPELKDDNQEKVELHSKFSYIVQELRAAQAQKLIQNSLVGRYNPTIAKLILSGKHNYVEKQETDMTTNGKDLPGTVLVRFVGEHDERADNRNTD